MIVQSLFCTITGIFHQNLITSSSFSFEVILTISKSFPIFKSAQDVDMIFIIQYCFTLLTCFSSTKTASAHASSAVVTTALSHDEDFTQNIFFIIMLLFIKKYY